MSVSSQPFGLWLREQRARRDMTRDECAALLGCAAGSLKRWELEQGRPSKAMLDRIFQVFEVPLPLRPALTRRARSIAVDPLLMSDAPNPLPPNSSVVRASLPMLLTKLYGRDEAIETLLAVIEHDQPRLLTLVGPAGVGKTRLALSVASRLPQYVDAAVLWIPLADVAGPSAFLDAIWQSLGRPPIAEGSLFDGILTNLREKHYFLVLDNCEHMLAAAAELKTLLEYSPLLRVMATSREYWGLDGEWVWQVAPLPLTSEWIDIHSACSSPAIQLLCERIRSHTPWWKPSDTDIQALVTLAHKVDGLPLALELMAAQMRWTPLQQMVTEIVSLLPQLHDNRSGRSERQSNLWKALEWSYQTLSHELRQLAYILSAFQASFQLIDLIGICSVINCSEKQFLDMIKSLTEKQWLVSENYDQVVRYRMLFVIREYLSDFIDLEKQHNLVLDGLSSSVVYWLKSIIPFWENADWQPHVDVIWHRYPDIERALKWSAIYKPDIAIQICQHMNLFWFYHGMKDHFLLIVPELYKKYDDLSQDGRAFLYYMHGLISDEHKSLHCFRKALEIYIENEDFYGICRMWAQIGGIHFNNLRYDQARLAWEEAYASAQKTADPVRPSLMLMNLGELAVMEGDFISARNAYEEALRRLPIDSRVDVRIGGLLDLADFAIAADNIPLARRYVREAVGLSAAIPDILTSHPSAVLWGWELWMDEDTVGIMDWLQKTHPVYSHAATPHRRLVYVIVSALVLARSHSQASRACLRAADAIYAQYVFSISSCWSRLRDEAALLLAKHYSDHEQSQTSGDSADALWAVALHALAGVLRTT